MSKSHRYLIAVFAALSLILVGSVYLFKNGQKSASYSGNQVVMYALTTCSYCEEKQKLLKEAGIPFSVYYIDTDKEKYEELEKTMLKAGHISPMYYGTPIIAVNGVILLNNPPVEEIRKYL